MLKWKLTTINNGNRIALLKDETDNTLVKSYIEDDEIIIEQCVYDSNRASVPINVVDYLLHGMI